MGTLVFQATLGGAINLIGPNTASTVNFTLPSADGSNGQFLKTNGSGVLSFATATTAPGGSTTQVQYNNAGAFAGSANMTFDGTNLTLANGASIQGLTVGRGAGAVASNTAVGASALAANTSGGNNTAIGRLSAITNLTASNITAVGNEALKFTTVGNNTAVGAAALFTNSTGQYNVALGQHDAGGYPTLYANISGSSNTGIGSGALANNTTASSNTAVGYQAAQATQTSPFGTFVGAQSGYGSSSSTGTQNVGIGYRALFQFTTGEYNTAVGSQSLYTNSTGSRNTAVGYQALYTNTTNGQNVAIGYYALNSNTGTGNVCVGDYAGVFISTGSENICIGKYAGYNQNIGPIRTGGQNILIGADNGLAADSNNYTIVVGQGTGKGAQTGFINPGTGPVYQGNNSSTWSTTSDQRLKKNIVDNTVGLDAITSIRVRNFEYRVDEEITELPTHCAIKREGVQLGVIAQELQAVLPDCVKQESTGVFSVDPDNLTWYMVNAIKQLKAEIDKLKGNV